MRYNPNFDRYHCDHLLENMRSWSQTWTMTGCIQYHHNDCYWFLNLDQHTWDPVCMEFNLSVAKLIHTQCGARTHTDFKQKLLCPRIRQSWYRSKPLEELFALGNSRCGRYRGSIMSSVHTQLWRFCERKRLCMYEYSWEYIANVYLTQWYK